jgi:DNA-directed RNA polymerase specialized sigma24 family protein
MGEGRRSVRKAALRQRVARRQQQDVGPEWERDRHGRTHLLWRVPDDAFSVLLDLAQLADTLEDLELQAVVRCRLDGDSWADIAQGLGVSAQAAHARYADEVAPLVTAALAAGAVPREQE